MKNDQLEISTRDKKVKKLFQIEDLEKEMKEIINT